MGKIEHITQQVEALAGEELKAFLDWIDEFRADQWDRQIESDAKAGKLEKLAAEALAHHRAGRTRPL